MALRTFLYIGGSGHSGSTLLDMLLGTLQEVTSLGEVHSLAKYATAGFEGLCTCGAHVTSCSFWLAVQEALRRRSGDPLFDLCTFPLEVDRSRRGFQRYIPSLSDALLVLGSAGAWRTAARISQAVRQNATVAANTVEVYEAAALTAAASVVVDSTKDAVKLKSMFFADPSRYRLLYLVRDGRAVCASEMRREGVTMRAAARAWRTRQVKAWMMMASIPRRQRMMVRYEELCQEPRQEIDRVLAFLGVRADNLDVLRLTKSSSHNIGGNLMRFRYQETEIKLDDRWRHELNSKDLRTFAQEAGLVNRILGYR